MTVAHVHLVHPRRVARLPERASRQPRSLTETVVLWVVVMTAVFLATTTLLMWLASGNLSSSLALAGFSAVWGGPGFGIMAGAAMDALRRERDERRRHNTIG